MFLFVFQSILNLLILKLQECKRINIPALVNPCVTKKRAVSSAFAVFQEWSWDVAWIFQGCSWDIPLIFPGWPWDWPGILLGCFKNVPTSWDVVPVFWGSSLQCTELELQCQEKVIFPFGLICDIKQETKVQCYQKCIDSSMAKTKIIL